MNRGDLILVYKDNVNKSKCYIVYDKGLVLGMSLTGATIQPVDKFKLDKENTIVLLQPMAELTYRKKKELTDILFTLLTGERKLSFKEKINFFIYVSRLYKELLDFTFTDYPATPVTPQNVVESSKFSIQIIT